MKEWLDKCDKVEKLSFNPKIKIKNGLKGAINVPLGSTAAARVVAYGTHFGGFIDSVGSFRKSNVNDGSRYGTRVSLLWQPTPELKITPRVVYQDVKANGFPREEIYNFYDNRFVTQNDLGSGKRLQYLKLPEVTPTAPTLSRIFKSLMRSKSTSRSSVFFSGEVS